MEYENSGVVETVTPKSGFQSIKFKDKKETFSNWSKTEKLSQGDIIDYNFEIKGDRGQFRNITTFRIVKSTTLRSPEPSYEKASELPTVDVLKNLPEVIMDGKKILNECKCAVQDIFNTEELKSEHIACVNTLFIWSSKEVQFRK